MFDALYMIIQSVHLFNFGAQSLVGSSFELQQRNCMLVITVVGKKLFMLVVNDEFW
jgi:ABC-type enterochelin transport system permease subunit